MPSRFDDLMTAHGRPALLEHLGESVTYIRSDGFQSTVTARVERHPEELGVLSELGPDPIILYVSKVDIPSVRVNADKFIVDEKTYSVAKQLKDRGGMLILYCVH